MNYSIILLLIISLMLISGCGRPDYAPSYYQDICHDKCINEGWTYGDALGDIACNCYSCEQTLTFEDNTSKIVKC